MIEEDRFIRSREELVRFFHDAFTPPEAWRVGVEFEKIGVDPATGRAIPYSGRGGVEELLRRLVEAFGWEPHLEGGRLLELHRGEDRITLEPGAQLELSGAPHRGLHQVAAAMREHVRELLAVSDPDRIAWLGIGAQPVSRWEEIELIPKARYAVMDRYLPTRGDLGRTMMRETAAIQLNLDYQDERDAMEKFRLCMALSPLFTALFANSCISGGRPNGFLSRRAYVWQRTDPHRCGFLEGLDRPDAGFSDYVNYALRVPMFYLYREGEWIDLGGRITFEEFLAAGWGPHRPRWNDWVIHLATIFTEARFKPYLEVRGADCAPPGLEMVFPALVKGLLYDREARRDAWEIVRPWSGLQRRTLCVTISREGPEARIDGVSVREHVEELVRLSRRGLERQREGNPGGEDETVFLEPLEERFRRGWSCPAREILDLWNGPWGGEIGRLIEHCRFT